MRDAVLAPASRAFIDPGRLDVKSSRQFGYGDEVDVRHGCGLRLMVLIEDARGLNLRDALFAIHSTWLRVPCQGRFLWRRDATLCGLAAPQFPRDTHVIASVRGDRAQRTGEDQTGKASSGQASVKQPVDRIECQMYRSQYVSIRNVPIDV